MKLIIGISLIISGVALEIFGVSGLYDKLIDKIIKNIKKE